MSKLDQIRALREQRFAPAETEASIAVYRCYDQSGNLLYVGQSLAPLTRIVDEHSRRFAGALATVSVVWYATKAEALAAERAAIAGEQPLHNKSPGIQPVDLPRFRTVEGSFDRAAYQKAYMRDYMRKRRANKP